MGVGRASERFAPLAGNGPRTAADDSASQASEEGLPTPVPLRLKGFLAQAAIRAVADVETNQLVAAAAGAQVLRRAGEGRGAGCERQDHCHRHHLLAGLAVEVDLARLGMCKRLAARGRRAHAIELLRVHGGED
jgi:hypothetical protein